MVIAKFKDDVTPDQIRELVPAEQEQAKNLDAQGLLGTIKVALPKRTVFLEVFAASESDALENLQTLPLAKLWTMEIYETTPPAGASTVAS